MAATNTVASRLAAIAVLIPALVAGWYAAPYFLPVWRWQNMQWEELARKTSLPQADLERTYQVTFRFAERGPNDPMPWQIIEMAPEWKDGEEHKLLVRATIVSDRTGEPISALQLGSGSYRDRYFTASAWRFPPGTFGFNSHRPVVVFDHDTLSKAGVGVAMSWEEQLGPLKTSKWPTDDEDVDDGYHPPEAP